jgi:uncharacterized phage-associated protein
MPNRATDPGDLKFVFEERRAVQAAAILLRIEGGRENYTKLLKLLYLADRRSLLETGRPITGSSFVNMANGPVLSEVYECIKCEPGSGLWDCHVRTDGYDVELLADAGDDQLSDYDVQILTELAEKYRDVSYTKLITVAHQLPEWRHPEPAKVASLPAVDVLRAVGEDDETIAGQAKQNAYVSAVRRLLYSS